MLLLQVAAMLGAALVCGELARRIRMPAVIGELVAGILLGPTCFNLFPTAAPGRDLVARFGLICFLFVAGLELNLHDVGRNARTVVMTSLGGIVVPFACAVLAVQLAPAIWKQPLGVNSLALFMGAALAISALPVIARIIHDLGFERLPLAAIVLSSATVDDLLGWLLFAILTAARVPWSILTPLIFLAGALLSRRLEKSDRARNFVLRVLAPLFFVSLGLKIDFATNFDWLLVAVVIAIACLGKIAGATLGARIGGLPMRQALAVGMAMNARGAVEIVLASVALEAKLIDTRLFVALVVMAVVTSAIAGPALVILTRADRVTSSQPA
jgi:Kef-type K+ transport system membrane component KefB